MKKIKYLGILGELARVNLSLAVSFSAAACYFMKRQRVDWAALYTFLGVFLLSASASALNQYQERAFDAIMGRTKGRPIPSGRLSPAAAVYTAFIFGIAGFSILFFSVSPVPAFLGILTLLWYNVLYTPLKRAWPYAFIAGAFSGAIPPIIGWSAAGGGLFDHAILIVSLFMYLWQIPHFLLLNLEYREEYSSAGFPSVFKGRDGNNAVRIIFFSLIGAAAVTFFFPLFKAVSGIIVPGVMILAGLAVILYFYINTFTLKNAFEFKRCVKALYYYQAAVLILIMLK